jgi:hypothetical protein
MPQQLRAQTNHGEASIVLSSLSEVALSKNIMKATIINIILLTLFDALWRYSMKTQHRRIAPALINSGSELLEMCWGAETDFA